MIIVGSNTMIIIGLSGKKQRGKDTFFKECSSFLSCSYCQLAFADGVYEELAKACNIDVNVIRDNKSLFRRGLQFWGTDFRRQFTSSEYWIQKMLVKLTKLDNDIKVVFITDVRFPNEYKIIKDCYGYTIRVNGPYRGHGTETDTEHESETALDNFEFDYIVDNNSDLLSLRQQAFNIIESINKQQQPKARLICISPKDQGLSQK